LDGGLWRVLHRFGGLTTFRGSRFEVGAGAGEVRFMNSYQR
jgi:hypothetical protein